MADETDRLTVGRRGPDLLLRAVGRVTAKVCPAMREAAEKATFSAAGDAFVFLHECTHFDSTFLGTLLNLRRLPGGGRDRVVTLVAPSAPCLEILKQTRTICLFQVAPPQELPADAEWGELPCDPPDLDRVAFATEVCAAHETLSEIPGPMAEAFRNVARAVAQDLAAQRETK